MRLTVDANILIGESLRVRGRSLLGDHTLQIVVSRQVVEETLHERERRVALIALASGMSDERSRELLTAALDAVAKNTRTVETEEYEHLREEAVRRIPRDPDDWHTVAAALLLGAAIWTNEGDFLGCGVATWTTETLLAQL